MWPQLIAVAEACCCCCCDGWVDQIHDGRVERNVKVKAIGHVLVAPINIESSTLENAARPIDAFKNRRQLLNRSEVPLAANPERALIGSEEVDAPACFFKIIEPKMVRQVRNSGNDVGVEYDIDHDHARAVRLHIDVDNHIDPTCTEQYERYKKPQRAQPGP